MDTAYTVALAKGKNASETILLLKTWQEGMSAANSNATSLPTGCCQKRRIRNPTLCRGCSRPASNGATAAKTKAFAH
jgi:hypothetical protein